MGRSCSIVGCTNRSGQAGVKFFSVPRGSHPFKVNRRRLWLQAIQTAEGLQGGRRATRECVCGAHFISGKASIDCDSPDFVPSIFPPHQARYARKRRRSEAKSNSSAAANTSCAPEVGVPPEDSGTGENNEVVSKKDFDHLKSQYSRLRDEYAAVNRELQEAREENNKLKDQVKKSILWF